MRSWAPCRQALFDYLEGNASGTSVRMRALSGWGPVRAAWNQSLPHVSHIDRALYAFVTQYLLHPLRCLLALSRISPAQLIFKVVGVGQGAEWQGGGRGVGPGRGVGGAQAWKAHMRLPQFL